MKLTIELVPSTSWYNNLRSILSESDWNYLRKQSYKDANYKCQVCGGIGKRHPVECHEIWSYDDSKNIQKLEGLVSLCPKCHMVKHIGYAYLKGNGEIALSHLIKVNKITQKKANKYIEEVFYIYRKRSTHNWEIDLTYLEELNLDFNRGL